MYVYICMCIYIIPAPVAKKFLICFRNKQPFFDFSYFFSRFICFWSETTSHSGSGNHITQRERPKKNKKQATVFRKVSYFLKK